LDELERQVAALIIEATGLEDVRPADVDPEAPLFVEGLGLDSIDALEIGLALKRQFGISLSDESEELRSHFGSVRSLAKFVAACQRGPGKDA
jgi:acyl carrier protein